MIDRYMDANLVTNAIFKAMREGIVIDIATAEYLDRLPWIEQLRDTVSPEDIDWLLQMVEDVRDQIASLAVSLLHRYVRRNDVSTALQTRYQTASPYLRNRLMWRLLGDPDLPGHWHADFRHFIQTNPLTFQQFNRDWYSPVAGLSRIMDRLEDSTVPASKKWIYLYTIASIVDDPRVAGAIIDSCNQTLGYVLEAQESQQVISLFSSSFSSSRVDVAADDASLRIVSRQQLLCFLANAVLLLLRKGLPGLSDEDADLLNSRPLIDHLREAVEEADLAWLVPLTNVESEPVAGFYLSLTRRFCVQRDDLKALILDRWDGASDLFKAHLMWRILDDPGLSSEWQERIEQFVFERWPVFQNVSTRFLVDRNEAVMEMVKRIGDPSFARSKKWVYLCRAVAVADDQDAAQALVNIGLELSDNRMRAVAQRLLGQFF